VLEQGRPFLTGKSSAVEQINKDANTIFDFTVRANYDY
jgi:hypothetical protein